MADIKSTLKLSGTIIDGITLGDAVYDEVTGEYLWDDHRIPAGVITELLEFEYETDDGNVKVDLLDMDVKFKPKEDVVVVKVKVDSGQVDDNGDPILVEEDQEFPVLYEKGDIVTDGTTIFECQKDDVPFDAGSNDWKALKDEKAKDDK